MRRNYLPWKRPEGHYPDRDGLFIAVVPTEGRLAGCRRHAAGLRRRPARGHVGGGPAPRSASGTRGRPPAGPSARPARPRTRAGSRRSRRRSTRTRVVTTVTANPASEASTGSSVLWVAYRLRASRCPIASNGTDEGERREHRRGEAHVLGIEVAPAEQHLDRERPDDREPDRREDRQRRRSSAAFCGRAAGTPGRSPAAQAPDRVGNAASEMATPISATGTLWKLRAKLTAETLPATRVEATLVKNRNVSGSIGWLAILGTISSRNSWRAGIRRSSRKRTRTVVRVMPMRRMPRWRNGADDRADRGRHDPEPLVEQDACPR